MIRIYSLPAFEKSFSRLQKRYRSLPADLENLVEQLRLKPDTGIALGKGLYKVRMAIRSKGKGKSGGGRVITYWVSDQGVIVLLVIYDKSELESIENIIIDELRLQARALLE